MADTPALYEAMDKVIEVAPDGRHIQGEWFTGETEAGEFCGSAGCLFGWRAFLDGYVIIGEMLIEHPVTGHRLRGGWAEIIPARYAGIEHIESWARRRLALTHHQAMTLSDPDNTLEDLKLHVDAISAGELQ